MKVITSIRPTGIRNKEERPDIRETDLYIGERSLSGSVELRSLERKLR